MKRILFWMLPTVWMALARGDNAQLDFQMYLYKNHYGAVRTQTSDHGQQEFKAKINGQDVTLGLDTGAQRTVLTDDCARRLHLALTAVKGTPYGLNGKMSGTASVAQIDSFTTNDWPLNHLKQVSVLPRMPSFMSDTDGLFGYDSLRLNSSILIIGGAGFLVRPGPPSPVPISSYMKARGFTPVPLRFANNCMFIAGSLQGRPITAEVDCGAAISTFQLRMLRQMDYLTTYAGGVELRGVDGRGEKAEKFTTDRLMLGSFPVPTRMMLTTDSAALGYIHIDALLGIDLLADLHGVVDTGAGILWVK